MSAIRTVISERREAVRGPAHWARVPQPQGREEQTETSKLRRWGRRGSWDPRSDSQRTELHRDSRGPQVASLECAAEH